MECVNENNLFHFHENPNYKCPVGKNIHNVLDDKLNCVQAAMERELQSITLEDVKKDLDKYLKWYGTQKKVNLTGSVATISSDKLVNRTSAIAYQRFSI